MSGPLIFLTIVHVLLSVFLIFVILLQPGKDAGMGAALGGGAATSAFGGRGAVTFLGKVTAACALMFFGTSLLLSFHGLQTSVAGGGAPAVKKAGKGAADAGTVEPAGPTGIEQPAGAQAPEPGAAPNAAGSPEKGAEPAPAAIPVKVELPGAPSEAKKADDKPPPAEKAPEAPK